MNQSQQQKFRINKQELEVMFDVEPSEEIAANTGEHPQQCTPPTGDTVSLLNGAEVRVSVDDGVDGVGVEATGEGAARGDGGQKVTPWEVEVRQKREISKK